MATALRPRDKGAKKSSPEADRCWGLRWSYAGLKLTLQKEAAFLFSLSLYRFSCSHALKMPACLENGKNVQALSIALRALEQDDTELTASLFGLVLISPWLDLSCGSHTYEAWHKRDKKLQCLKMRLMWSLFCIRAKRHCEVDRR